MTTTATYTMDGILRNLTDAAADLESRAAELREVIAKVKHTLEMDPANLDAFVDPRNPFFTNLQTFFDNAQRSTRVDQSRTMALNLLVAAYGSQVQS